MDLVAQLENTGIRPKSMTRSSWAPCTSGGAASLRRLVARRPSLMRTSICQVGPTIVAVWGGRERSKSRDSLGPDEVVIGRELGLLQEFRTVERLDLLEDLEVISNLDRLASERQG